jgi:hypothetical protein
MSFMSLSLIVTSDTIRHTICTSGAEDMAGNRRPNDTQKDWT